MGTAGSFLWIKGLRYEPDLSQASSMNEWGYTSTPRIRPAVMHKVSFIFMMCWKSHYPLHAEEIQFLKSKYLFSALYYAKNHSCGNLFFIYVYPVCV